ncbi:MAG: 2-enoyl thioester reductase domain-containing protein [Verrucomicrobiota bacterium]
MKTEALAVRYHEVGKPGEVLILETLPVTAPATGEALVALRRAVIHPSDMGMIGGTYGRLRELPAVAGREGVGEVVAIGKGVTAVAVGDRVRMPDESGAWIEAVTARAENLVKIPAAVPLDMAAQAFVNPTTAVRLLNDFAALEPGDWVIQNAATSAVGTSIIQYAKHLGLHTLNVVRDSAREPFLAEAGADVVVAEDSGYEKQIKELTGGAKPKLALNSIGGDSVIKLIRAVADGGYVVTFGGMVGDKVRFPTRNLIFNDVRLVGFWMDLWLRVKSESEIQAMLDEVYDLLANGVMSIPVDAIYPFGQALEAVAQANTSGRNGKVLIAGDWQP